LILPEAGVDVVSISRLQQAFSSEDERTIQGPYLIHAFMESPVFGSGFGGYAGYQRNDLRPWTYELTYQKLLFNMGIVGTAFLLTLFCLYLLLVIKLLRRFKNGSSIPFGLLVAFCSTLVGAYSNPYFGSFDFLFFVGLLPFLSTFQLGFDRPKSTAGLAF
jgi:O-antigen ligase